MVVVRRAAKIVYFLSYKRPLKAPGLVQWFMATTDEWIVVYFIIL